MKETAITENHLYQKTFRSGKRWSGHFVTVCVLKDRAAHRLMKAHPQKQYVNRIGLSVPKREGGAIVRNRVKRIIREGLRAVERKTPLKAGYLIVISPRPGIERQKSPAIEADLRWCFRKLDMIRPADEPAAPSPVPHAPTTPGEVPGQST